jgi:putative methionine-R-sulfoxide reductase with GAF domain
MGTTAELPFARFVELNVALERSVPDAERRAALRSIVETTGALLARGPRDTLRELPRAIGRAMGSRGWAWNGFYALRGAGRDELHLSHAFGPPVCAVLERRGGPLTSGMCFDALELNQTLAAHDAKAWPGYVSCDAASGLGTVAGIVSPLRDPSGVPIAVWDLDSTRPIEPGDVRFADVLFATLSRSLALAGEHFG